MRYQNRRLYFGDRPSHWDHAIPTAERDAELIVLAQAGDIASRDELILGKQRMIFDIATGLAGNHVEVEELMSAGNIGLLRAIERFDRNRTGAFATYAYRCIKGTMHQEIEYRRLPIRVPRYLWDLMRLYRKAARKLGVPYRDSAAFDRVCDELALSPTRRKLLARAMMFRYGELQEINPRLDEDEHSVAIEDADPFASDASLSVERLLSRIRERDAEVIRLRFGIGGGDPMRLEDISKMKGVTRERVRQLEARGLKELRYFAEGGNKMQIA